MSMDNAVLVEPNRVVSQRLNYRPSAKVLQMIELIVDRGMRWDAAADEAGLSRPRARQVIESERVAQFIRARRKLLRATLNARIEHTIERAMTGDNARTALEAVRLLIDMEQQSNAKLEQTKSPQQFQINIINRAPDIAPLVPHEGVQCSQDVDLTQQSVAQQGLSGGNSGKSVMISVEPSVSPESPAAVGGGKNPR